MVLLTMVLAPEHPLVPKLIESNPDKASLETFIERMRNEMILSVLPKMLLRKECSPEVMQFIR